MPKIRLTVAARQDLIAIQDHGLEYFGLEAVRVHMQGFERIFALLRTHPALFMVVKYVGAAYLTWVGVNLIRNAFIKWRSGTSADLDAQAAVSQMVTNMQQPFKRALVISLLNPKAILFLLSFFVQFIDPAYATPAVPFLILGSIIMVLSALYLSALIFAGARLAQGFSQRKRLSSSLSGAVGTLFVWFGAKLATASLN